MSTAITIVGPADHGRRMTLAEFEHLPVREGNLYELGRGQIVVSDVPAPKHLATVNAARRALTAFDLAEPGRIHAIAGGGECKLLLADLESERHPDLAVYLTPPPDVPDVWAWWIPEIVIEVVSRGSEHRDYVEKREEYFLFGVLEYWIIDSEKQTLLQLRRRGGRWIEQTLKPGDVCTTRLLPGFELNVASLL